jgi:hypothetical protein
MWGKKRRNGNSPRHHTAGHPPAMVGTQAKAAENKKNNSVNFKYPQERFIEPIEDSLIYSMVDAGISVYPESVVLQHIDDEDFAVYLSVSLASNQEGYDDPSGVGISYAQLSAILALSVEKFPPTKDQEENSISQKLAKKVLNTVIKYAEYHDLDRQAELKELLDPVEIYSMKRSNKAELRQVIPFYAGYVASIITANPIPMLVGFSVMSSGNDAIEKERENLNSITKETNRRADIEKTSLLDEQD